MELLRLPGGIASRFAYGAIAYWGLNIALVIAEMRWHLLARLTAWDIAELVTLARMFHR